MLERMAFRGKISDQQWYNYGMSYLSFGRKHDAIDCFYLVTKTTTNVLLSIDACYKMGCIFFDLERYNAIKCSDNVIEIYERINDFDANGNIKINFVNAWFIKGLSLSCLEKYTEAIKCFDKAIASDSNFTDAWHYKGIAIGYLGEDKEAIKFFDEVIKLDPNFPADAWILRR